MNRPSYFNQNCDLLLSEGLKEYYSTNPQQIKEFADRFEIKIKFIIKNTLINKLINLIK